jgi:hypothetical protein
VLFELPQLQAYHLYSDLRNGSSPFASRSRQLGSDGIMHEFPKHPRSSENRNVPRVLDDRAIFCYFRLNLQAETLMADFTDKQCTFLINLMTDNNKHEVNYE